MHEEKDIADSIAAELIGYQVGDRVQILDCPNRVCANRRAVVKRMNKNGIMILRVEGYIDEFFVRPSERKWLKKLP